MCSFVTIHRLISSLEGQNDIGDFPQRVFLSKPYKQDVPDLLSPTPTQTTPVGTELLS